MALPTMTPNDPESALHFACPACGSRPYERCRRDGRENAVLCRERVTARDEANAVLCRERVTARDEAMQVGVCGTETIAINIRDASTLIPALVLIAPGNQDTHDPWRRAGFAGGHVVLVDLSTMRVESDAFSWLPWSARHISNNTMHTAHMILAGVIGDGSELARVRAEGDGAELDVEAVRLGMVTS